MRYIEKALYNTMATDTTLANLVGGTASPRIYNTVAPQGVVLPCILFQKMGGAHVPDNPKRNVEVMYAIKAVSDDLLEAENIDYQLEVTLDRQSIGVNTDGMADYAVFRAGNLHFLEDLGAGEVAFHTGALYNIMVAAEQS